MRKHCKRTVRRVCAPVMVALHVESCAGLSEETALLGLASGWAEARQFDCLLDCADFLMLASDIQADKTAQNIAQLGRMALRNISDRFHLKNKFGASGEELKALRVMVDFSTDWWSRKSGALYVKAHAALDQYRDFQEEQRKAREGSHALAA